ncbi:MAG: two-component regulator propeller domain-containing protein [Anaerolineae bacterium]
MPRRIALSAFALITGIAAVLLLTMALSVQASGPAAHTAAPDSAPIAQGQPLNLASARPCGSGEQLPPWTTCLYGEVSLVDATGQAQALADVLVSISLHGRVVTGTTLLRPGEAVPTYEIDISPLEPEFLRPVTVTVSLDGVTVQRQVLVFPNFTTHSQRSDLQFYKVGALDPAPLWGYVVDFKAGGPVAGAEVVAVHAGYAPVTVTTSAPNTATLPIYTLTAGDLAAMGAAPGSTITVTARYRQDVDRQVIQLRDEAQQVNFVTGWRCDSFDPLPQVGGHGGLPQVGGHGGLPDVACVWGYGLVSGAPRAGMDVTVEISGTVYAGRTRDLPGEALPRYGIALPVASLLVGQPMTITGVYSGYAKITHAGLALDEEQSQRIDVHAAGITALNFSTQNVGSVIWHAGYLWAGTNGGLLRWNPDERTYTLIPVLNGHMVNGVGNIEVASDGTMWMSTSHGASHYDPTEGVLGEWLEHLTTAEGLRSSGPAIPAIDHRDGSIWFGSTEGPCHYRPATGCVPVDPPGFTRYVTTVAADHNGSVWFGSAGEAADVIRYMPGNSREWVTYTHASGILPHPYVHDITVATDGSVWVGTPAGVARYSEGASPEWATFTAADGLADAGVVSITEDENGSMWFGHSHGSGGGGATYFPSQGAPIQLKPSPNGLASAIVNSIALNDSGTVWFGTPVGISQYVAGGDDEWTTLETNSLSDSRVKALALDHQGDLWVGTQIGLDRYDSAARRWDNFDIAALFGGSGLVQTLAVATDGSVWFGGAKLGRFIPGDPPTWEVFDLEDGLVSYWVWDIAPHPDGSIWIGTIGGVNHITPGDPPVWETYTTTHGLPSDVVGSIGFGADGSIWFGTNPLSRYFPISNTWQIPSLVPYAFVPIPGAYDIARAPDDSMWFSSGWYTYHYYPASNTWESFYNQWTLVGGSPSDLYVDENNTLWCVVNAGGVCRYDHDAVPKWEQFGEAHGIPDAWANAIIPDGAGAFWVGTDGGLVHWTPPVRQSDVAVQLHGQTAVHAGDLVTYTISVRNDGQVTAHNTGLLLALPDGLSYQSATPPPASTSPLTWNLGSLVYDSAVTVTLSTAVNSGLSSGVALTTTAMVTTTSPETYLVNNTARWVSRVRSPYHADVRASLAGPPLLVPGHVATYTLWVDNDDELAANDTVLDVVLPPGMSYQSATPPPAAGLTWQLGVLPGLSSAQQIALTVYVDESVPAGAALTVSAIASTSSPESNAANNTASSTVATSLTDAQTLILVAPDRLAARYGASPLLTKLYAFAQHPNVQGAVVDVTRDPQVRQRYQQWDANPASWLAANDVATETKALIDQYTDAYPNLRYLVIVGGDEIIPFYRVADQNPTQWHERRYSSAVPNGTVRAAKAADRILTDDFYADRNPTRPTSIFWPDSHPLYLPDFAIGRLVESPQEIIAALDAFLASNGTISQGPALVAGDQLLADDLRQAQCHLLQQASLPVDLCTVDGAQLRNRFLSQPTGSTWLALHSNHFSSGLLSAASVAQSFQSYAGDLMVNIGCHAGLNVGADQSALPSLDLVQAMLGKGGVFIGPTAYSYASTYGMELSERLAIQLTGVLLDGTTQDLGTALVRAKQAYFTSHEGWFNTLDEKVLLPMTLYGPPMYRFVSPNPGLKVSAGQAVPFTVSTARKPDMSAVRTYSLNGLTYSRHDVGAGAYFALDGEVIAQDGLPVQPAHSLVISSTVDGQTPHGIVLRSAHYTSVSPFDPVIAQSWAAGMAAAPDSQEAPASFTGWDRPLPYALGRFSGQIESAASINLALGRFNQDTHAQQLLDSLVLEVHYSADVDVTAPVIVDARAYSTTTYTNVSVTATDTDQVDQVVAVCDDGVGQWQAIDLQVIAGVWSGTCYGHVSNVYVQVVDRAGNVAVSDWFAPTPQAPLAVTLADFQAECIGAQVALEWETVSEVGNMGFNLWRSFSPQEPPVRLNDTLIPSQSPGSSQGATYSWLDETAEPGVEHWYWLEAIDLNNHATRFGPVGALCQIPTAVRMADFAAEDADSVKILPFWLLVAIIVNALIVRTVRQAHP